MEENNLPVLPGSDSGDKKGKVSFLEMVQQSIKKGTGTDPLFFSDILNEFEKEGNPVKLDFTKEDKERIAKAQGNDALKEWEKLYDHTIQANLGSQKAKYYEPLLNPTYFGKSLGFTDFKKEKKSDWDKQNEYASGFVYPLAIKTQQEIAEKAPSIIDYDPMKGYFERKISGEKDIDKIVSMTGEDKRLTMATNSVVAETNPKVKEMIANNLLNPEDYYKDEQGMYRYRTLKPGERPTHGVRSVWGPEKIYHSSYVSEVFESLNDFLMDSMDAAVFIAQLPIDIAMNASKKGLSAMGIDFKTADAWNDSFNDYRNWSQSRRSTKSWEEAAGPYSSGTDLTKAFVNLASQILVTRGMGAIGGASAKLGSKMLAKNLSEEAVKKMMTGTAMGYNYMYASAMASEEARQAGLGQLEGDAMAITAGAIIGLTEKMTGGQFTDKVFGPVKSKIYSKKIVSEINEQLAKLNIKPTELLKDENTFKSVVGNVFAKTHRWLSETAETRMQNTIQGGFGEMIQETSEDALNKLAQEFRDYLAGEDSYDNSWRSVIHELSGSAGLGFMGGAFGGSLFFNKKHWEMSRIDEDKYDWMTNAVLRGETNHVRTALEKAYKEGTLGSTMISAMQGSSDKLLSQETDPVAQSQNEMLYRQFKSQLDLIEEMTKKYSRLFPSKNEMGDFITKITGGKDFVENDFADIELNTAHMMQREAIALEVKRNHAKNMLALELAKSEKIVDLSGIESVYAYKGKVINITTSDGKKEVPNITVQNALEEALRKVEKDEDIVGKLKSENEVLYVALNNLRQAEYVLSKDPSNPEYNQARDQALDEFNKLKEAYEKTINDAGLDMSVAEILDELKVFSDIESDFKKGERKSFYQEKASLEAVKKSYSPIFKERSGMTVYDWREKKKDYEYFKSSVAVENQKNIDLTAQFDQLVSELQGLKGDALQNKVLEIMNLSNSSKKYFISPASVSVLQAKVAEIDSESGFTLSSDLGYLGKQGEFLNTNQITQLARMVSAIASVFPDGKIDKDTAEQIESFKPANFPATEALITFQDHKKTEPLEVHLKDIEDNYDEILKAIEALKNSGLEYENFSSESFLSALEVITGKEMNDYLISKKVRDNIEIMSKGETSKEIVAENLQAAIKTFSSLDFSSFADEDLNVLARAFNSNLSNNDNAGASIIAKFNELLDKAKNFPEEFTDLQEVEKARKDLEENYVELILEHELNDWGKENGAEKFNTVRTAMLTMNNALLELQMLANENLNKRSGRDYKIKQDYVNFSIKQLLNLNATLKVFTPEEVAELEKLSVVSKEATTDEQKEEVDSRLEKFMEFEEKASNALREVLAQEGKAKEILDSMGMTVDSLFSFNANNRVSRSVFRDLHEDNEKPYDPENPSSMLEQAFNYLVQLERGNVRSFFNRFKEIISDEMTQNQFMPSFEQALSARQLFGFLYADNTSILKTAINEQIPEFNGAGEKGKIYVDSEQIFVRGIAGAGKSSFVTKLAFELFGKQLEQSGSKAKIIYTAPNQMQVSNIGKAFEPIKSASLDVAKEEDVDKVVKSKATSKEDFGGANIIVIDEATLLGQEIATFQNRVAEYNKTAPQGEKIKIVLIGDEYQNGPDSNTSRGIPQFYSFFSNIIVERSVPLTTPYRTGKIESYNLQMVHRKIISEISKMEKALKYGMPYKNPVTGKTENVTSSNWKNILNNVFIHYNSPKAFNYSESAPGVIGYGLKNVKTKEELNRDFITGLVNAIANGTENNIALIIAEDSKDGTVAELEKTARNMGVSITYDQIHAAVFTSKEIQGSSKNHVYVSIDLKSALDSGKEITDFKSVMQAYYVAESRETETLVFWHPGNHSSVKNISKNSVLSYPQINMDDVGKDGQPTKEVLEIIEENKKLAILIKALSRPEAKPEPPAVIDTDTAGKGEPPKPETTKPKKTKTMSSKTEKTEEEKNAEQDVHNDNLESDVWAEAEKDPMAFAEKAVEEFPTDESIWIAMKKDIENSGCSID